MKYGAVILDPTNCRECLADVDGYYLYRPVGLRMTVAVLLIVGFFGPQTWRGSRD